VNRNLPFEMVYNCKGHIFCGIPRSLPGRADPSRRAYGGRVQQVDIFGWSNAALPACSFTHPASRESDCRETSQPWKHAPFLYRRNFTGMQIATTHLGRRLRQVTIRLRWANALCLAISNRGRTRCNQCYRCALRGNIRCHVCGTTTPRQKLTTSLSAERLPEAFCVQRRCRAMSPIRE